MAPVRPWRATPAARSTGPGTTAIAFAAIAALACAGAIHWSAARDHSGGALLIGALSALAALQLVAAALLMLRGSTAVAAVAALAGLVGWAWSASPLAALGGHSAAELPALATVALELVAVAAVLALRISRPRAWIDRHATLVWGAAVPVASAALVIALLVLTQSSAAHAGPAPHDVAPSHGGGPARHEAAPSHGH